MTNYTVPPRLHFCEFDSYEFCKCPAVDESANKGNWIG